MAMTGDTLYCTYFYDIPVFFSKFLVKFGDKFLTIFFACNVKHYTLNHKIFFNTLLAFWRVFFFCCCFF